MQPLFRSRNFVDLLLQLGDYIGHSGAGANVVANRLLQAVEFDGGRVCRGISHTLRVIVFEREIIGAAKGVQQILYFVKGDFRVMLAGNQYIASAAIDHISIPSNFDRVRSARPETGSPSQRHAKRTEILDRGKWNSRGSPLLERIDLNSIFDTGTDRNSVLLEGFELAISLDLFRGREEIFRSFDRVGRFHTTTCRDDHIQNDTLTEWKFRPVLVVDHFWRTDVVVPEIRMLDCHWFLLRMADWHSEEEKDKADRQQRQ